MKTVQTCDNCNCEMFDSPSKNYGRCPACGYKLYPNGYSEHAVSDDYYDGYRGKIYPAPSWEND